QKIRWVLEMMRGPELAGARITRVERSRRDDGVEVFTFHDAAPGDPELDLETTRDEMLALGEAGATIAVHQLRAPVREVVAVVPDIPAFGWRTFATVDGALPTPKLRQRRAPTVFQRRNFVSGGAVLGEGRVLENEHLRVEVDPADGTLTLESDGMRITGANRYVDGGDGGDTYNYSPPTVDRVIDRPDTVTVDVLEPGPVRARLLVTATYRWPSHAIGDEHACRARSDDTVETAMRTTLELRAGERFVRVRVDLDHRVRDHRLRAHFPLATPVTASHAECAFAVVERGLTAEGGPHEVGLPTFVSRRFVDAGGVALLHDGLLEYEVVDGGTELALTLLRATGYLSRSEPSLRPNPAGPLDPLEGPQLQRRLTLDYAVYPHRGDWHDGAVADAADDFLVPLERVSSGGLLGASRPSIGTALSLDGARLSALTRDADGAIVARLVNLSSADATARVAFPDPPSGTGRASGQVVNLLGEPRRPFADEVALGPWEIVTLRFD
ncbi:MAG TPA: glycoside hydrolase family 38 C-terminal domain-containing protein, partial [Acidimicrobiia bacterium]|nr:glycoside hydrolase family 38 C-terminal domain-containing protein [Acidimicrobiia bacterium]